MGDFSKLIHREGYIFIVVFAAVTFLFASFMPTLGVIGLFATLFCAYFFRNPDRYTPLADGLIISPADGVVQNITDAKLPPELGSDESEKVRISIFLNILNVHVNRVPTSGKIEKLHYHPGKFFNASLDKASTHNERQSILMKANNGEHIAFIQIAGLIAKRIVCDLEEGDTVEAGSRFGIIRFGSRVDVYLPKSMVPLVCKGQTVVGGETVLADFNSKLTKPPKFKIN